MGGQGGPKSQQAHDVEMTSMRRNDVASTSFRRHVPTRFLINQCQIITFLILKSDIIENSRLELKGVNSFASTFKSNKSYTCIYNYFTLQLGTIVIFSCFTQKLKEMWVDYWGGGGVKGYVGPPSQAWPPCPPPLFLRL